MKQHDNITVRVICEIIEGPKVPYGMTRTIARRVEEWTGTMDVMDACNVCENQADNCIAHIKATAINQAELDEKENDSNAQ